MYRSQRGDLRDREMRSSTAREMTRSRADSGERGDQFVREDIAKHGMLGDIAARPERNHCQRGPQLGVRVELVNSMADAGLA